MEVTLSGKTYSKLTDFENDLRHDGCRKCSLGFQPNINGVCISRGNPESKVLVLGEAPGRDEDAKRLPFTGPAGQLLDKLWKLEGLDTNDFYLTNVVLCRPVAPKGSGRQNLTPKAEQIGLCTPYLRSIYKLLEPQLVVTLGKTATEAILLREVFITRERGVVTSTEVFDSRLAIDRQPVPVLPMFHPAALLHAGFNAFNDTFMTDLSEEYYNNTLIDLKILKEQLTILKLLPNKPSTSNEVFRYLDD